MPDWLFDDFALVLGRGSEKPKNNSVKLGSWEVKLFWKYFLNHFFDSYLYIILGYSWHKFIEDLKYEIFWEKKKLLKKCRKNYVNFGVGKIKIKTWFVCFFKCLLNFRAHALQSELSKFSIFNFVEFRLQSMSSKIEIAFKKPNIIFNQNRAKKDIFKATKRTKNQCKKIFMRKKKPFFL